MIKKIIKTNKNIKINHGGKESLVCRINKIEYKKA